MPSKVETFENGCLSYWCGRAKTPKTKVFENADVMNSIISLPQRTKMDGRKRQCGRGFLHPFSLNQKRRHTKTDQFKQFPRLINAWPVCMYVKRITRRGSQSAFVILNTDCKMAPAIFYYLLYAVAQQFICMHTAPRVNSKFYYLIFHQFVGEKNSTQFWLQT